METPERVQRFSEVVEIVDNLLRNETTTYQGHYYQIKEAMMHPSPIQKPRPTFTIATAGKKTLVLQRNMPMHGTPTEGLSCHLRRQRKFCVRGAVCSISIVLK